MTSVFLLSCRRPQAGIQAGLARGTGKGYTWGMNTKESAIHTIQSLPDDASWEDIRERINFVAGVRKGLQELDEGKAIAHEKVKEEFNEWLSG